MVYFVVILKITGVQIGKYAGTNGKDPALSDSNSIWFIIGTVGSAIVISILITTVIKAVSPI